MFGKVKFFIHPATLLFALSFSLMSWGTCCGQETVWPQFRGPQGKGSTDADLPVQWTEENFKWRIELPGKGWSSPVYVDGKAWMTAAVEEEASDAEIARKLEGVDFPQIKTAAATVEFHALCVDLETGKLLHDIVLGKTDDPQPINPMNSYASPTPVIADGKVVCNFGAHGTWCINASTGESLWDIKFVVKHSVGPGSSPIVTDSKVIFVCDGMDKQFVAAADLETGKEVWRTNRPPIESTNGEFRKSYCTPIVEEIDGKRQIIVTGADWICAYDPENGDEVWRLYYGRGYSVTGMPVLVDGLVVCVTGFDVHQVVAFDPNGKNQLNADAAIKWRARGGPSMSSIIEKDGTLYYANERGVLSAVNAADGNVISRARIIGNLSSSPLQANGKLYIGNRDGKMVVVRCDESLETLHEFDFQSAIMASPSPIGDDLLIRTEKELIRISNN